MEMIVAGRRGGKTTRAMEWLSEDVDNRVMVYSTVAMARMHYRAYAHEYGLDKKQFKGLEEARGFGEHTRIGIENLDLFKKNPFRVLLHNNIDFVTVDNKWFFDRINLDG